MEILTKIFQTLGYTTPASQTAAPVVFGKMALDQLLFAPAHTWYYMHAAGFLEGRSWDETTLKISRELWPLLLVNWKVWPLVQILNFKFVAPQLRVLTLNISGMFWMVYVIQKLAAAGAAAAAAAAAVKK